MTIKTSILPGEHHFARTNEQHELHLEALCVFVATGFFLGEDTYWKDEICLSPGAIHSIDDQGIRTASKSYFKWNYSPRNINFNTALDEYIELLNRIIKEQIKDKQIILPLSGGLDSRSLALCLKGFDTDVHAISYSFEGGYPEHRIAERISKVCGFKFNSFKIPEGYLWDKIDAAAVINQCFSEFTNPRQLAIMDQLKDWKGIFLLGHWGDVLFDKGITEDDLDKDPLNIIFNKIVKPKGLELASVLWDRWGLIGSFEEYLRSRIKTELDSINIDNKSAKIRAFKTKHWANRWTTTNMGFFNEHHKIAAPYYDDKMCEFICTIPEDYLADRKLQIAHLKTDKNLSSITWQRHRPFSINNYHLDKEPFNLPYRLVNKIKRELRKDKQPYIQRNWELQFMGSKNESKLKTYLYSNNVLEFIDKPIIDSFLNKFKEGDAVNYAHPLSMLLTLSLWFNKFYKT